MLKRSFSFTPAASSLFKNLVLRISPSVKEISPADLAKKIQGDPVHGPPDHLHIIDVRETYEWNSGAVPYAKYVGKGVLERDIESVVPDPNDEIILYCAGGVRSLLAADSLQKMGFKNVYSLKGGIGAWKQQEFPVVATKTYSE